MSFPCPVTPLPLLTACPGGVTVGRTSHRDSSSNGGDCIEVGTASGTVAVRDSKDRHGPALAFTREDWQEFTRRVRSAR